MSRPVGRAEVDRLGKRGSYRLGGLSQQGTARPAPPRPLRPWFTRPRHAGTPAGWLLGAVAGTLAIAGGAAAGLWYLPFAVGLVTGFVMRWGGWRFRVTGPAVLAMSAAGWGLVLWLSALRGLPIGPTAQVIAALLDLPAGAAGTVAVTLLVSVAQGLTGLWLGRALVAWQWPPGSLRAHRRR
ncbi:MAG TPA: hypothetical protein VNF47_09700 [Streptosporangiaceae bacterium]|nr:hypothetical protein [Streptosporangiaceae bacterium]